MKERNEISGYFNAFNNLPCHEWLKYNSIIAVVLTFVDLWLDVWFSILVRIYIYFILLSSNVENYEKMKQVMPTICSSTIINIMVVTQFMICVTGKL